MSEGDLKKLPLIKWCNLETICLRAPDAITRKVMKPVKILVSFGVVLNNLSMEKSTYFAHMLFDNSLNSTKHSMTLE